jgi:putative hydrolase of the HAD superfamily
MLKKSYEHIFFDLDHTLWDYERSAEETLGEIYDDFELDLRTSYTLDAFFQRFKEINASLWHQYNHNKIDSKKLRSLRFRLVLEEFARISNEEIDQINKLFMERCPVKPYLMDGCVDILEFLSDQYTLHIITNGFEKTQHIKLNACGITGFFDSITTSEKAEAKKPDERIFDYAIGTAGASHEESIMIGDNLRTDILGASRFGMDQVYFGIEELNDHVQPTYKISHLKELKTIL